MYELQGASTAQRMTLAADQGRPLPVPMYSESASGVVGHRIPHGTAAAHLPPITGLDGSPGMVDNRNRRLPVPCCRTIPSLPSLVPPVFRDVQVHRRACHVADGNDHRLHSRRSIRGHREVDARDPH